MLWNIYKEVFGQFQPKPFIDIIKENVKRGVYDKAILKNYTETELKKLYTWIKEGFINPRISMELPLEKTVEAMKSIANRKITGKAIVIPNM